MSSHPPGSFVPAKGARPDIVLLDLHLQDLSGEQVLNELRARKATAAVPVAVLSADASPSVIRRLLANGAIAYLTKPLDLAELGALIGSYTPSGPGQECRTLPSCDQRRSAR